MEKADQIVAEVLKGDREAFAGIVDLYEQNLWKTVNYFLENRSLVEEVVQRAFLNAYAKLETYRLGEGFGQWIKAIARNEARMELRKAARDKQVQHASLDAYAANSLLDDSNVETIEERRGYLRDCMEQLSESVGEIIRLRYEKNEPSKNIAEQLNKSIHSIDATLSRARIALRECIGRRSAQNEG